MALINLDLGLDELLKVAVGLAEAAIKAGASKEDLEDRVSTFRAKMEEETAEAKAGDIKAMDIEAGEDE